MGPKLTNRQRQVLTYIESEMEKGHVPTFEDIAKQFKFTSNAARSHVNTLAKKKCLSLHLFKQRGLESAVDPPKVMQSCVIDRIAHKPSIVETPRDLFEIPFYSKVLPIEPFLQDRYVTKVVALSFDKIKFIKEECFAFECFSGSISGAGILKGDIIIAQKVDIANSHDIVLANIQGQNIIRRIFYGGTHVILFANTHGVDPQYYPVGDVVIICKCLGIHRLDIK